MIDPDELMEKFEAEEKLLESLIQRSIEQTKDIKEMQEELTKLKESLEEDGPIQSEQSA